MLQRLRRAVEREGGSARATRSPGPIVIIGAGFAGIGMGIKLKQAGIDDFVILEQAGDLGGTWRDNSYPGCACDVPSHLYSFSFEPNPHWTRMFAPQPEIWAYMRRCVEKHGLARYIRYGTRVERAVFDEASGHWEVQATDGSNHRARVLISGCGGLSRPAMPDIAGLDTFGGKIFHSARWDHDHDLTNERVAVIGTGASAIQIVPEVARIAKKLSVFQRTPPWLLPRPDRAIGERERSLYERVPALQSVYRGLIFWQLELRALGFVVDPKIMRAAEWVSKSYLTKSVADPVLRQKLLPTYTMGCKRVLMSNDYYPALQQGNVELVTESIERVTERGVLTKDGRLHELDILVLATGFQAAEAMAPFEVRGRRGLELSELWREGGEAYLGTVVSGFPNLFLLIGPNTTLGHNSMIFMMESQMDYVLKALDAMEGGEVLDVRPDVQARFNAELQAKLQKSVWNAGCSSWYLNRHGKNTTAWPGFSFQFRQQLSRFDRSDYQTANDRALAQLPQRKQTTRSLA